MIAKMEPFEVETKDNIAAATFGKENGEAILDFTIYNKKTDSLLALRFFFFFFWGIY